MKNIFRVCRFIIYVVVCVIYNFVERKICYSILNICKMNLISMFKEFFCFDYMIFEFGY